jgi:hypothetical protein
MYFTYGHVLYLYMALYFTYGPCTLPMAPVLYLWPLYFTYGPCTLPMAAYFTYGPCTLPMALYLTYGPVPYQWPRPIHYLDSSILYLWPCTLHMALYFTYGTVQYITYSSILCL